MILSQFEETVRHRRGSHGDVAEPWHHGGEIVTPIEAIFEFGEGAGYMLVTDDAVSAGDGTLDVAEGGIDPFERGDQGGLATRSGDDWLMTQPALLTPVKQRRPSLTMVLAGSKLRFAKAVISARRNLLTRRNFKRLG